MDQCGGPSLFSVSSQCHKADTPEDYIPDDHVPRRAMDVNSSRNRFRSRGVLPGLLGHFSSLQMERIERLFATVGETDPWGTVINPLAVILEKVEEAWRSANWTDTRSVFENKNVARVFLERKQAPHEESVKGHDNLERAVFSELVPRSDHRLTRCTTFRTGAGPASSPLLGTRGGAGAPEH